jgi:hypothetical protein
MRFWGGWVLRTKDLKEKEKDFKRVRDGKINIF